MSDAPLPPPFPSPLPPPLPHAPPTVPGALSRPPSTPAWPMVIGIIAVVFAAFGMLQGVGGIVSMFVMDMFAGFVPQDERGVLDAMTSWKYTMVALYGASALVTLLLGIGGVLLMRRRPLASPMIMWWAALKMLAALALVTFGVLMQVAQFEAMANAQPGGTPMPASFGLGIGIVTGAFQLLWLWALPVFMLVWFTRKGVRKTVHEWRQETAAGYR